MTIPTLLPDEVFRLLLGHQYDDETVNRIGQESLNQIHYSIRQLTADLQELGYSHKYARLTAEQITPKPVLYSLIVGYLSNPSWVELMMRLRGEERSALRALESRFVTHCTLQPREADSLTVELELVGRDGTTTPPVRSSRSLRSA